MAKISFKPYKKTGYEVSRCGKVRGLRGTILKPALNGSVYLAVSLHTPKPVTTTVHSMVAHVWIGPKPKGKVVNHKDGNKMHNRVDNLEYVTSSGNTLHALAEGLRKSGGERSWAVLTNAQVFKIVKLIQRGARNCDIAEEYGVEPYIIRDIRNGKSYRKVMEDRGIKYPLK